MNKNQNINRRSFLKLAGAAALYSSTLHASPPQPPNVILIYTDDQEFDQLGCYGGHVLTPNIDRLATEGARLTQYHVNSPVCTPSRYCVLTGRYAGRCQYLEQQYPTDDPAFIRWNTFITRGEKTIAHLLKRNGYRTGIAGKYHLFGNESRQPDLPLDADPNHPDVKQTLRKNYENACQHIRETAGFDETASIYANNLHAIGVPEELRYHNMEWVTQGALNFIDHHQNKPFFLYFAPTIPHGPLPIESMRADTGITPLGYLDKAPSSQPGRANVFERVRKAGLPESAAPLTWLDDAVGALIDKLEQAGLRDNTLILFASDHGKRGKMTCYESASNAPCIANWPGHIPANTVNEALVANIDLPATVLAACGVSAPADYALDCKNLLPLLQGNVDRLHDSLLLEVAYTRGVVTKGWKYIAIRYPKEIASKITESNRRQFNQEGTRFSANTIAGKKRVRYDADKDFPGYFDDDQLYNLAKDPREQNNLAAGPQYAEKLKEMQSLLKEHSHKLPHEFGEF